VSRGIYLTPKVLQCYYSTMALTRIKPKFQITLPQSARTPVGLKVGDFLDATPTRGGILLRPKVVVDMDKVELDKRLEAAVADVKAGRVLGPFKTASATMRALKQQARRARRPR
jgi:AbrB family looped-hinge helix DNA binding protein